MATSLPRIGQIIDGYRFNGGDPSDPASWVRDDALRPGTVMEGYRYLGGDAADRKNWQSLKVEEGTRSIGAVLNDTMIEIGNAMAGGAGAIANFASPGNRFSQAIEEFIKSGEQSQSDVTKAAKAKFRAEVAGAEGFAEEAGAAARYALENPLLAAGQAAGSFALPGGAIKGVGKLAQVAGLGARGTAAATTAAGSVVGGAMAGGDAAGEAYELVYTAPEEILRKVPAMQELLKEGTDFEDARRQLATQAAREASVLPAIVGGVSGAVGLERVLGGKGFTGGVVSRAVKGALVEGVPEAFEEGLTTFEARRAASQFNPEIDPLKGVGSAAALGGILGAGPGAAVSAISPQRNIQTPPPAPPATPDALTQFGTAVNELQQAVDPYLEIGRAPNVDTAIANLGPITSVDLTPPDVLSLAQRRAAVDRNAELVGQANAAGTDFDRRMALAQAQVSLPEAAPRRAEQFVDLKPMEPLEARQRLAVLQDQLTEPLTLQIVPHPSQAGKAAIARVELPLQAADLELPNLTPAVSPAAAQNRIESAALAGQEQQRRAEDAPRQDMVSRVMANIEARGGVASPYEAEVLRAANMGQPFNRIDPSLGRAATADEQLTAATGVAVGQEAGLGFGARESTRQQPAAPAFEYTPDLQGNKRAEPAPAPEVSVEQAFVQQMRETNTPAARAFVKDYEAGRISDTDVSAALELQARLPQSTQQRIEGAAAQAQPTQTQGLQVELLRSRGVNPALAEAVTMYGNRPLTQQDLTVEGATARVQRAAAQAPATQTEGIQVETGLEPRGAFLGRNEAIRQSNQAPAVVQPRSGTAEFQGQLEAADDTQARLEAAAATGRLAQPSSGRIVTSGATLSTQRNVAPGATLSINDGVDADGKAVSHQVRVVDPSAMGSTGKMLTQVGRIFGKKLVAFESDTLAADGFVMDDDNESIYINTKSQISPLAVFGHEMTHLLKRDNAEAYNALQSVVQRVVTPEGQQSFQAEYGQGANLEELTSDLVGNRFREESFWTDVFNEVAAQNPEGARGIITRMTAALTKAVNAFLKVVRQPGFQADQYVSNLNEVKAAVRTAFTTYAKQQRMTPMQAEGALAQAEAKLDLTAGSKPFQYTPNLQGNKREMGVPLVGTEDRVLASRQRQTETAEFQQFYEGSQIRDNAGQPVVLYRGMRGESLPAEGVESFTAEPGLYGTGIYMSSSARRSEGYTKGEKGQMYPVFASVKNPIDADDFVERFGRSKRTPEESQRITDQLIAEGYDGVVERGGPGGFIEVMAFRPEQVKSATGNQGSFDAGDARITMSPVRRGGVAEEVGEFKIRTQKDGTLGVAGDVEQIRALLPEGIRGRAVPGGVVFTTSDAPRVRAALEGRKLAYSRGGQVIDKLPMKDGKYVGAPEKYNTPAKIAGLRKSLRKLTLEGERGRYWYENSSREVLQMVGGNVQEARKFVALLAIYSPQAKVDANSTFALRAWAQYKAGQPISVKTAVMDNKAQAALDDVDAFWSGEKTGNFFFNLLREIDPSTAGKQGATIDMWMMRAGEYSNDAPTATQYAFMENETNRLAQELGWEPQQVQAAIWVAMKARMENPGVKKRTEATSEKKGWLRYDYPIKNGRPVKTRVILNAQKHRDNWLKHAFEHNPTADDTAQAKFDFSDGLRRHIGQLSWEARPGRSTNVLPGVNDAPYAQQVEFQQAVQKALLDDNGVDLLAYKLGLLVDGPDILAPGIWQGEVAAGMQKLVALAPAKGEDGKTSIDPAQKKAIETYAATLGLLLRQEGVGYHRPFYKGTKSAENGVSLELGRTLTPDEAQGLWAAIDERMGEAGVENWENGAGMISSPNGMRVVNFGALPDNGQFRALVKSAAETLAVDEVELQSFSTDGDLVFNDWKESPNGEGYRSRIREAYGPDLLDWARDVLAPRVQSVFTEFSSRYGWGDPGRVDALFEPAAEERAAEEITFSEPAAEQAPAQGAQDAQLSRQRTPFTVETSDRGRTAVAKVGSRIVGRADAWQDSRDKFVIMNTEVRPQYRRRGIARAMYSAIEQATGQQLTPAVSLSDDAYEFWKSYRPEAVARDLRNWKDQLIGARVEYRGDTGRIIKASGGTATMEFDTPKENGATQRTILRDDLNDALAAAGSPTIDFDSRGVTQSRRRNILGQPAPLATWTEPAETKLDDVIYVMQDKLVDTKRVVEAIKSAAGGIDDKWNPYLQEELFHGRSAKQTKDFLNSELRPLIQDMQARGVDMAELEEYLHNRHAEERNIQIAKVNPGMPDGGSGIDTADARAFLAALDPAKRRAFEALAQRVDRINKGTRDLLVASGLETQETIDKWDAAYSKYVPLFREDLDFASGTGQGTGQGYNVRGPSSKRATGSRRDVVDIMANVAMQRERAIVRAEKARVAAAVYGLAVQNPNTDFWLAIDPAGQKDPAKAMQDLIRMGIDPADAKNIIEEPTQNIVDPRTGLVVNRVNPLLRSSDNVLAARINGEEKYVFFNANDERAQRMVSALKNLDADQLGRVMSMTAAVTRYFASINTQYNPIFGAVNFLRDVQGAAVNLTSTPLDDRKKEVMAGVIPALRGIYSDLRSQRAGKGPAQGVWAGLWEEFQREGGQTGFRDMFSRSAERGEALQRMLDPSSWADSPLGKVFTANGTLKVPLEFARQKAEPLFDWLSDYNETMENAVRLSAYKAGLDKGLSKEQAASIAKNLTVNFNRKGQIGTQAGALYAFFNASVQGTARLAETLKGPAGKKIMAGGLLLGTAQAMLLAAAGFDQDEPPDFVKERNLIIPLAGGKYLQIPMPLGLNVIPNTSRVLTEWAMSGFKDTGKRVAQITGAFLDMFNPIGNAGWSMQTLAPTVLDPLAALRENKDWTGKPIAKEDRTGTAPTPGYTRAKETASWLGKEISYYLNLATGGTKYKQGVISPTPDQIDYLIGVVTGGVGREVLKVEQTARSAVTGEELPPYKVPLLGRFYGDTKAGSAESTRFYANITRLNEHEAEIKGRRENREDVTGYLRENPEARLVDAADRIEREVQELKRKRRELVEKGAPAERVKLVEERIKMRMKQLNDRVRTVNEKALAE